MGLLSGRSGWSRLQLAGAEAPSSEFLLFRFCSRAPCMPSYSLECKRESPTVHAHCKPLPRVAGSSVPLAKTHDTLNPKSRNRVKCWRTGSTNITHHASYTGVLQSYFHCQSPSGFSDSLISPPAWYPGYVFTLCLICVLYIKSIKIFLHTPPRPGFVPLEATATLVESMRCLLPEVKRNPLIHFLPTLLSELPSTAPWKEEPCHHEFFLFKEIIFFDARKALKCSRSLSTSLPKFAWPLKQPANQSADLAVATNILAAAASVVFYWGKGSLQLTSEHAANACYWYITGWIWASTSPLIKTLPLFTSRTTVINVPTSTSGRRWGMSVHQLGIALSS